MVRTSLSLSTRRRDPRYGRASTTAQLPPHSDRIRLLQSTAEGFGGLQADQPCDRHRQHKGEREREDGKYICPAVSGSTSIYASWHSSVAAVFTALIIFIRTTRSSLFHLPFFLSTPLQELREIVTAAIGTKFSARWGEQMVEMVRAL